MVVSQAQVSPERAVSVVAMEDTDVARERSRIRNTPLAELHETEALVLSNLVKYYGGFLAVDGLSLGIKQGIYLFFLLIYLFLFLAIWNESEAE